MIEPGRMAREVTLVDAGLGNLASVERALIQVRAGVRVTSDPDKVATSRMVVFPGQSAFGAATQAIVDGAMGAALRMVIERGDPFLGICLGMQLLNVHRGGDLVQDIPKTYPESGIKHASPDGWNKGFNEHSVRLVKGSRLYEIYQKEELQISTSHHQAVRNPGDGLKVVSSADDGVIEAIELDGERMVIGVQWHPERGYDLNKPLFDSFVKASTNGH